MRAIIRNIAPLTLSLLLLTPLTIKSQNVGIGETNPASKLSIKGNVSIGDAYSALSAPSSGLIVQGNTYIGTRWGYLSLDVWVPDSNSTARIYSDTATNIVIECPANYRSQLEYAHTVNWTRRTRFTIVETPDSQWLIVAIFDTFGGYVQSALSINRYTGFMAMNSNYNAAYRLTLSNDTTNEGKAVAVSWISYSDSIFKSNIITLATDTSALTQLIEIPVYEFKRTDGKYAYGFIAQDIAQSPFHITEQVNGYLAVDYWQLLPVLIYGIQENDRILQDIAKQLEQVEKQLRDSH
ncbi:MAG: hypothetical protein GXO48_00935 [Chlorobi bacterium]|nr:hypothetical protein [Chlorobiota bacterium]